MLCTVAISFARGDQAQVFAVSAMMCVWQWAS